MKKKCNVLPFWQNYELLLRMKLLSLFLFLFVIQVNASVYSQSTTLSLNVRNISIDDVLKRFQQQSDFLFIYRSDLFQDEEKIDVNVKKIRIEEFLEEYIIPIGYEYEVINQTVVIRKAEIVKSSEPVKGDVEQDNKVTGKITDESGKPLPGVTITVLGSTRGVITDADGKFEISNIMPDNKLVLSFIGMESQIIDVGNQTTFDVTLKEKIDELEEVTVVAFGRQKKESVIASVTTIRPEELKVPSSNLTTALAGRVSGLISYQSSGEPGQDDADFFIRGVTTFGYKKSPLILIDGIELTSADLARLQTDDIASFSIFKDATATALYGARGANGVIMVTTKEGKEGKVNFDVRYESSWSQPTDKIEFADPITYMNLHNEAVLTRNSGGGYMYSPDKIARTANPDRNQYVYPAVDWQDMLFKDVTNNSRLNMSASGGGKVARYFFSGSYTQDNGALKVDKNNNFNNNIDIKKYLLRSNININVTPTTKATVRFYATFDDYTGPLDGGGGMYNKIMKSNPVLFPAYFEPDEANKFTEHTLFGNANESASYINPYADMVRGYQDNSRSLMLSQFEVEQDLDAFVKGLKVNFIGNINRTSFFGANRFYNPFYYEVAAYDIQDDEYTLSQLNPNSGTEALSYSATSQSITSVTYLEGRGIYNRTFNEKHTVGSLMVLVARESKLSNASDVESSLASRNLGLSGRFTYGYDSRYFAEFNFGYNGSERFSEDERFGFFPSAGFGWVVSNENFWAPLENKITKLKLKATYGTIGNDAIGDQTDRFFYLAKVNLNAGARSYQFGTDFNYSRPGNSIERYANEFVTWEESTKLNLGLELDLFNDIRFQADYYTEYRTNILMTRADVPSTMGLQTTIKGNIGEASSSGVDLSLDANHTFDSGFWVTGRANFTYATSKFEVFEEPNYTNLGAPWRSRVGQSLSQQFGYVAERLFIDEADVENSPEQFGIGEYGAGDIKFKDIDGNGRIDDLDKVAIGHPTSPEIVYGFGSSMGYKNFDFSFFFQGLANRSFWINPRNTAPFLDTYAGGIGNNALLQVYADNVWLEEDRDPYAMFPRLSTNPITNNEQVSTWFMRDGAFIRLKSVELGYSLPKRMVNKLNLTNTRFYASATNLLTFSKFNLWDVEMAGNGLGYPIQKVVNLGVQLSF